MRVLLDASCIIAMARSGRLSLLERIVEVACVTPEVRDELLAKEDETATAIRAALGDWITLLRRRPFPASFLRLGLDGGEASLIAASRPEDLLVMDDRQGRALARSLGRDFTGLVGLLVRGVELGRIKRAEAVDALEAAERAGFWVSATVRMEFRAALGALPR